MKGLIVKGIGGFYYVRTESGVIEAKGRGIFKKDGLILCVGDEVDISILPEDDSKGVIEKVYPRKILLNGRPLPISTCSLRSLPQKRLNPIFR